MVLAQSRVTLVIKNDDVINMVYHDIVQRKIVLTERYLLYNRMLTNVKKRIGVPSRT